MSAAETLDGDFLKWCRESAGNWKRFKNFAWFAQFKDDVVKDPDKPYDPSCY